MGFIHKLMNWLFLRTKSLFVSSIADTAIGFVLAILLLIMAALPLPFKNFTWTVIRAFIASVSFSLLMFYIYQKDYESQKDQKYVRYRVVFQEKVRYRAVLWRLILFKSFIFVPIFAWILFLIAECFFNYIWFFGYWSGLSVSWIIWCAILWIDRKIARKNRIYRDQKSISPFYDKK